MSKQVVKLAECMVLAKGKPPVQMPFYGEGAEPYLNPDFLRGNASAELAKPAANAVRVEEGDTILLWDGSNAGEFFRGRKGLLASTMSRVSIGDGFAREYFFYAVKRWEPYLKGQTSGSGIPHVDKEVLGKLEILRLDPGAQRQIATILLTLDQAIEKTEAIIAKQQRIKAGLMQDLLTKGIDEHGVIRSEATHKFKDSPLERIPVEWEVLLFGDVVESAVDGPFGSNLKTEHYVTDPGVRVLRLQNIGNGVFNDSDKVWVSSERAHRLSRHSVQPGDLLVASLGDERHPFGRACLYPSKHQPAIVKADVFRIRCKAHKMDHSFAFRLLNFPRWRSGLFGLAQGVTRDRVNLSNLKLLRIPGPELKEQSAIATLLDSAEKPLVDLMNSCNKLRILKSGLMHDLLTGKVRVKLPL